MVDYVITGCAGSGTAWASRVMRSFDARCGHQRYFATTGVNETVDVDGDSSWCAVPHVREEIPVVFLRRDPLDIVRSIDQLLPFFEDCSQDPATTYVSQHRPDISESETRLGRIIRFVGTWGIALESQDNVIHSYVDYASSVSIAAMYRHLTSRNVNLSRAQIVLNNLGTKSNSHSGERSAVTWDTILSHPDGHLVTERAERWGYR